MSIRPASEMDRRLTAVEVQMVNLTTTLDRHVRDASRMLEKLDDKTDKQELMMARLIGGLIVAQFLAILFAPALRAALGIGV